LFIFFIDVLATSVAFVEMTAGSDFLRKMSLLRRKVRRRDVIRYMSPHLRESIEIRKQDIQGHTMNSDAGTYLVISLRCTFLRNSDILLRKLDWKSFRQRQQILPKGQ